MRMITLTALERKGKLIASSSASSDDSPSLLPPLYLGIFCRLLFIVSTLSVKEVFSILSPGTVRSPKGECCRIQFLRHKVEVSWAFV